MKILFTGGGTGGHVYPAVAIYEAYRKAFPEDTFFYIGTDHGMEASIIPKTDLKFKKIEVYGFQRKWTRHNIKRAWQAWRAVFDVKKFLKEEKIDLVIGTGGYVSGPVLLAAKWLKIPALIHEQNVFPGMTNRFLSRWAKHVFLSFEESRKFFSKGSVSVVGNPIRKEYFSTDRTVARAHFGILPDEFFVLSFGGSVGQKSLNEAILEYLKQEPLNIRWLHVTGARHFDAFKEALQSVPEDHLKGFSLLDYCHDNPKAMVASDLVIASAGAIGISEICGAQRASLLVPKAYTTNNHQLYNAKMMQEFGASEMLAESELDGTKLKETISRCFLPPEKRKAYEEKAALLAKRDTGEEIVKVAETLIRR